MRVTSWSVWNYGSVSRLEVSIWDESVSLGFSRSWVASNLTGEIKQWKYYRKENTYLCGCSKHPKRREGIVKQPFINVFIQVPNKEICADIKLFFVWRGLHIQNIELNHGWNMHLINAPCWPLWASPKALFGSWFYKRILHPLPLKTHKIHILGGPWRYDPLADEHLL